MKALPYYGDRRWLDYCVMCTDAPGSRDHVPSKVLLDEPYPENLPVVACCERCNRGVSLDEEYLACFIECALRGGTEASRLERPKVAAALSRNARLQSRIEASKQVTADGLLWFPEWNRVERVVLKLARGHCQFELSEVHAEPPSQLRCVTLSALGAQPRGEFEEPPGFAVWPEVGSRAMQRLVAGTDLDRGWVIVQDGRYRYAAGVDDGTVIKMVLSEYAGFEVRWDF